MGGRGGGGGRQDDDSDQIRVRESILGSWGGQGRIQGEGYKGQSPPPPLLKNNLAHV